MMKNPPACTFRLEESPLMDPMVEGEKILNKKAVYEPTSSQRCRQLICSRRWAIAILVIMGLFILTIALIAAFARPGSILCQEHKVSQGDRPSLIETTKLPDTGKTYLATNGQLFPWKDIRLPRSILPDTYKIFLHPNISESVFSGRVTINASVVDNTDFIIFHVKDLNITSVKVLRGEVEVVVSDELEYKQNEQYYVKVRERLPSESRITIIITFSGALVNKLGGFYKSSYKTSDGQTREIATTHFEPTDARTAFPCFDEPDMKANFTLSVIREKRHVALFNMPLLSTSDFDKGLLKDDFMMSVKMSTYLVAFIICDFKNVSAYTKQNILVRVFAPEEQISQAKFALDVAVKVLDYYDDFFGVPYPLPKQDMIAIPDFAAGAMENWGLITYRMTSILYDPQLTSASGKQWIAIVVAHELAHQWFGNLVTMKWWDDLWLNEGFASFVEYIGADVAEPEFHMKEQFISDSLQNALYLDSFSNSHPILVTVQDPSEINEIFDKISYDKGACLIRMLEGFVGEQQFKAGLSQYLRTRSYGNAQTADLWEAIQNAGDKEIHPTVAEVMDTWTLQMGYPVVTVTRQPGSNVLYLTQSRFLMGKQSGEEGKIKSPYNYTWVVPFTYVTSQDPKTQNMQWMNMDKANITVSENVAWIKGNYMSRGFYRVNYEESLWRDIIKQLIDNHTVFSTEDRAGLIDDAFNLARAGLLKYDIVFELLSYMMKETEYVPWLTAISSYDFIDDRMYLTDIYPLLQKYMLGLINNQLSALGWNPPQTHLDQLQQMMMLGFATSLDHKPAIEEGKKKFELWKVNKTSILQNQISLACKLGVEYGDEETWQYVWNQYVSSTVPTEKRQLLGALTSSRDPRRLQMFLQDSLNDSKVRSQDSDSVIQGIASNSVGQIFAWRFLQRNWDTIFKRYGQTSFLLGEILKGVISPFNTQFDYDEVQKFFADKEMGSGSMALKQSLETVQMHIDWNNKYAQGDWTAKLATGKPPMRRARTEF